MKTILSTLLFCILLVGGYSYAADEPAGSAAKSEGSASVKAEKASPEGSATQETEADTPASEEEKLVLLETTKGRIVIKLFYEDAPEHAKSFTSLVKKGFYDGTYFHRLVEGFVVQGGDPKTKDDNPMNDGTGGPGYKVKNEANKWSHKRGRVAAARTQDPNSAGSQFYFCLVDLPQLDQMKYTVFGEVVEGMDVVDKIVKVKKKSLRPQMPASYPVEKTYIEKASLITRSELKKD